MRTLLYRAIISLFALYVASLGVAVVVFWAANAEFHALGNALFLVPSSVIAVLSACFSLFLVWRGPGDEPTLLTAVLVPAVPAILSGAGALFAVDPDLTWIGLCLYITTWILPWIALGALLRLSAVFPVRLGPEDVLSSKTRIRAPTLQQLALSARGTWLLMAGTGVVYLVLSLGMILILFADSNADRFPMWGLAIIAVVSMVLIVWQFVLFLMGCFAAYRNLRAGYLKADHADRARVLWAVSGLVAMFWLGVAFLGTYAAANLAAFFLGQPSLLVPIPAFAMVFSTGAPLLVFGGFAMAVLYRGALDPRLALARATLWGLVSFLFLLCFAALDTLLSEVLEDRLPMPGFASAFLAGAVSGGVLWPFRRIFIRASERVSEAPFSDT